MTRRTQAAAERTPKIGDAIGHYRLVGVVGEGSVGPLYAAEQRGIRGVSNTVALRCIRPELAQSPHFRALFIDAASLVRRFEHPNLVSIYEMDELDGTYFFSMEYLPAENVTSILTKCNTSAHVPPDIAASVVKHAANGVQYLHELQAALGKPVGLGHGEVHPSNVFVTFHGTVKLLAVGLRPMGFAKGSVSGAHEVDAGGRTDAYSAPERFGGVSDRRADVFSLGALLWTCLTGREPHLLRGDDQIDALPSLGRVVAPSSVRAGVPEALDVIAMRALSPDPERRFQSVREMSEALDRYLVRRESRPTHKHIRRWLEQLFDTDRASLQMQIAQGRDVQSALSFIGAAERAPDGESAARPRASMRARELWSTRHSMFSQLARGSLVPPRSGPASLPHERLPVSAIVVHDAAPTLRGAPSLPARVLTSVAPSRAPQPRAWMIGGMIGACALVAIGTGVILWSSRATSPLRDAAPAAQVPNSSGQVEVRSTPEGAAVFVDGEPTGLRTPALLKGLAGGRSLRLRVDKAGFASQERDVVVAADSVETAAFELIASDGLVRFSGVPAEARVFVDESLVALEDGKPLRLSAGRHEVRVETQSSLVFSGTVVVVAGEQTIRVDGAEGTP